MRVIITATAVVAVSLVPQDKVLRRPGRRRTSTINALNLRRG